MDRKDQIKSIEQKGNYNCYRRILYTAIFVSVGLRWLSQRMHFHAPAKVLIRDHSKLGGEPGQNDFRFLWKIIKQK